ncbi:family 10 glycosylhydrolase [Scatolibacter rhodanostii]|uniref:family 10 glycosylhydrolase n=1 Tax=Scatolibacter rhodanostii TaxID=2014781 RepID=UPI0013562E9D|nr:family 10 glycosylhydrolase [Scatolibacter rhodanostii]
MGWWHSRELRMIQNNLRDIDVGMDVEQYVKRLKEFGANACMVGCGGITSFYPSQLSSQTPSPYLAGDFFGELINKCHEEDIKVIARFDFSKAHERFYHTHPEWFSVSASGTPIRYHDTVATCVNAPYQQEESIRILNEALDLYPVDGVFFNMFGYQTYDYTGNYVGICQCESCKNKFLAQTDHVLPTEEETVNPVFQEYVHFKKQTVNELLRKIQSFVHNKRPDVAVCTYNLDGADMVRNESNSAVDRPLPFWIYNSEYNVSVVQNSFVDKTASNCVINAVDIPYRFMGVSKYLNQMRLYGNMAAGGTLDWCIIGSFEDYPDQENFDTTKEVFHFHKQHVGYFSRLQSRAQILLVTERAFGIQAAENHECLGIYKMLKEAHLLFDLIEVGQLESQSLAKYQWIILPGIKELSTKQLEALQNSKAHLLATGLALEGQPEQIQELFGIQLTEEVESIRGAYLGTYPKEIFTSFEKRNWVYLDLRYRKAVAEKETQSVLPFIPPQRYGPPERCYGYHLSEDFSAFAYKGNAYFSWMPGTLYYRQGYEDFKNIVLNFMESIKKFACEVESNLPEQTEMFFDSVGEGKYLLQILNQTGFNGTTFFAPIPLSDIEIRFANKKIAKVKKLTLTGEKAYPFVKTLKIDRLGMYEAFIVEE